MMSIRVRSDLIWSSYPPRGRSFIFISIPGVATNSLKSVFYSKFLPDDHKTLTSIVPPETTYNLINSVREISKQEPLVFTFTRNPWSRVVSFYRNYIQFQNESNVQDFILRNYKEIKIGMTFPDFVKFLCESPGGQDSGGYRYWISQYKFIEFRNKRLSSVIYHLENYKKHLTDLIKNDLDPNLLTKSYLEKLPSHKDNYWSYYSDMLIEMIKTRYHKDIILFNYSFFGG